MTHLLGGAAAMLVVALLSGLAHRQAQVAADTATVALTFDDLPAHGPLPPGVTRAAIARQIVRALRDRQAPPVYGFINARQLETQPDDVDVLRIWRDAGFLLGNHSFSHMDLHANSPAAFEQDIVANEPALRSHMANGDWHWFRFPNLREGETPEKHDRIAAFLDERGYRVAQVTLNFDDWAYTDAYARCAAKQDEQATAWLKKSYLSRAAESLTRDSAMARQVVGRDIQHVMLLHVGALTAEMLPSVLELLASRGFRLTTLEAAAADPVYAMKPALRADWSGTFLEQLMTARQITPPAWSEDTAAKLAELCR